VCIESTRACRPETATAPKNPTALPARPSEDASSGEVDQAGEEVLEEPPDTTPAPTPANFPGLIPGVWRKHIYTGAMGATYFSLLSGMIIVAYVRELGMSYRGLGLLMGLGSFAFAFQLVGAHVAARIGRRRPFWFHTAMLERLFKGLAVVAAFHLAGTSVPLACTAFVAFMTLASVSSALAVPCWFSWLTDLIPAERHGALLGRRSAWTSLTVVCVALPCAWFIDRMTEVGMGVHGMLAVFALALVLGYLDLFIHRTIPEPHMRAAPARRFSSEISKVLRDARFRPVLIFKGAWGFSSAIGGMISIVYLNEYLGFRKDLFTGILALIAIPSVSTILFAPHLGALVDRLGCRRVLVWGHVLWSIIPLGFMLMRPGPSVAFSVAGLFLVTNFAMYAAMNAGQKLVTRLPRREDRGMYLAVSTCVGSLSVGAGALVAGEVMQFLDGWGVTLLGAPFLGYHVLFAASALLRLASTALTGLLPDRETEHATMRASESRRAA